MKKKDRGFFVTKIHLFKDSTNDSSYRELVESYKKRGLLIDGKRLSTEEYPYSFRVYDDDGVLYFEGISTWRASEDAFDYFQWDCGTTYMKIYDRSTKEFVDAIG